MRRRGTTLIEVLIAVSLLGLLSGGILMALRVGLNAMDRTHTKLLQNRRAVSVQRILDSQIAAFMPVPGLCPGPAPDAPPQRIPFFEGSPQQMRFVSAYSLEEAGRGYPHILEYRVIPGERNEGVRLIVNEILYTGPPSTAYACVGLAPDPLTSTLTPRFGPVLAQERSFVLADKLASCAFVYLDAPPPPEPETWQPEWKRYGWPRALRIEMRPLETDPTRVPLLSVVARIRVTRRLDMAYAD